MYYHTMNKFMETHRFIGIFIGIQFCFGPSLAYISVRRISMKFMETSIVKLLNKLSLKANRNRLH